MPQHLAMGTDVQHYTVSFNNTKTVDLVFTSAFDRVPSIQLTMDDSGIVPVYKRVPTKEGCKIKFKTPWTGSVEVTAISRGRNV